MKLIIELLEEDYNRIKDIPDAFNSLTSRAYKAIKNGKSLPKGHGDLIDGSKIGLTDFEIVMCNGDYKEGLKLLVDKIDNAPIIIEADMEIEND